MSDYSNKGPEVLSSSRSSSSTGYIKLGGVGKVVRMYRELGLISRSQVVDLMTIIARDDGVDISSIVSVDWLREIEDYDVTTERSDVIGYLARALGDDFLAILSAVSNIISGDSIVLVSISDGDSSWLAPKVLLDMVAPYIESIEALQHIIDDMTGRAHRRVIIHLLTHNSPISVSLEGASQAIDTIKESVVPWRQKHAEEMANLEEQKLQEEIANRQAEILERQARAAKDRAEAEKIKAEAELKRAEAERLRLENRKIALELQRAEIELALSVIKTFAPNMPEVDKLAYVTRLLPTLGNLITSDVQIKVD